MDDAELHLRLSACRPQGQDNDDPLLKEAMEMLPQRPGVMEWFTEEQTFDNKVCKCLGEVPVPENLKSEILASAKLNSSLPRWQRLPWLAAAAAIVLAGLAFTIYQPVQANPTLAQFENEIVDIFDSMKNNGFGIDHVTGEFANVSAWLATQGAPKPYVVKPCTKEARPFGCRTVNWRGQKVAMVCFGRNNQEAHLFVVPKESLKDCPGKMEPDKVERVEGYPVASWACRKYVYVMMGDSPDTNLDEFLMAQSDVK
jgi:hypothetical protein